ncbi:MAG: methyltransferase domain-containing protein [Treponema sp.]|nr:methyltransferase domain-containing protein [Treponema sp.]
MKSELTAGILVVPAVEKGRGGGHLNRCITLVRDLRNMGRAAVLYIPQKDKTPQIENVLKSRDFNPDWLFNDDKSTETFGLIILDRYKTPLNEISFWQNLAPVIGIDEGGIYRDHFDFLVDILVPYNFISPSANIASPALLFNKDLNASQPKNKSRHIQKILITFGQEDSAGLGIKTARRLSEMKNSQDIDITLLRGALTADNIQNEIKNVKVSEAIPNLAQHIGEYDLVITHYGITAYEALFAGAAVLLDHPTLYHKKLAKAAGFNDVSKIFRDINTELNREKMILEQKPLYDSVVNNFLLSKNENESLARLCNNFLPAVNRRCHVCGSDTPEKSIARFKDRTYRRCKKCGIIYMDRICPAPIEYEKEYFFESYKKQYGKTYLDDFDNIKNAARRRLKIILKLSRTNAQRNKNELKTENPSLLDIGCAYGPFLAAAKEEGFSPFGIDPAEDAVRYVNEKLGISAIQGYFPINQNDTHFINHSYNVITLWFVIEHFTDCLIVLDEIKKILKPGGILAFSTPSFSGISGRSNLNNFLSASPADHYTVWSPKMCKKALLLAGFKVKKIEVIGYHPERFPLLGKFAVNRKSFIYWILLAVSIIFKLGDTFEVYAQTAL